MGESKTCAMGVLVGLVMAMATWALAGEAPDPDKLTAASLVSFTHQDAYVEAVIDEFARQTGYELVIQKDRNGRPPNLPPVSLAIEKQPFWAAMREVCDKADLTIWITGMPDSKLTLTPVRGMGMGGNIMANPASIHGAFMTVITQLQRLNTADLADLPKINRNLMMNINVYVEPKVKIVKWFSVPDMAEAVDEKGNSLLAPAVAAAQAPPVQRAAWSYGRGIGWMAVPLAYPPGAGEKIASLRGKIRAVVQTKGEKLEIAEVMKAENVEKSAGGRRITLKGVKRLNEWQYQATIVFYRGAMDDQQFRDLLSNPGMQLVDADGQEFMSAGGQWGGVWMNGGGMVFQPGGAPNPAPAGPAAEQTETEVKLMFYRQGRMGQAGAPAEPAKLVWDLVTESREIAIPFEFKDLPLP
ncbi:MAG: hypothetical protein ACHRHE_07165 [Tepidisphaerales bacterium]